MTGEVVDPRQVAVVVVHQAAIRRVRPPRDACVGRRSDEREFEPLRGGVAVVAVRQVVEGVGVADVGFLVGVRDPGAEEPPG